MSKQYIPKQFTPFIYPEWGELFDELTDNQNAEILKAITKYPDYEPVNIPIWKFIKSQLHKDYENFKAKCKKRGEASKTYWGNKGEQMISNDIKSLPNDIKGEPKPLTTNHLPLTSNHLPLTEISEEEIKKELPDPDPFSSKEVSDVIQLYKQICTNLIPYTRGSRKSREAIAQFIKDIEFDFMYIQMVFEKANKLKTICNRTIDIQTIINCHERIANDFYKTQEQEEEEIKDPYNPGGYNSAN